MNNARIVLEIILLAAFVCLDAFFSAAETSFLLISRVFVRQMLNEKTKHAALIQKLKNNLDKLLIAVLLGTNIVVTVASALAASIAISLAGSYGVGIATGVMTCVIIIFGEIAPKTAASRNPAEIAVKIAPPLSAFMTIIAPLAFFFNGYTALLNRVTKHSKNSAPLVTEEELKTLIAAGLDEGALETIEKQMLLNVFEFTDLRVSTAYRHRSLVKAIPVTASYDEMLDAFITTGYSRLPVYQGANDNYIGLIHYKDMLFRRAVYAKNFAQKIMRAPRFVPGTMPCASLLQVFKKEKINFAVVVDEHGGNMGIITMEDILNAVLGKLYDEYNYAERPPAERITIVSETEFLVPGEIKISDFNEIFSEDFDSEYYDTLAGWLLETFDALPAQGDCIHRGKYRFEIEEQRRRRIHTVRVRKI